MKPLIIIPLYNEEKTINNVIEGINSLNINVDILIVNDNSTDNSISKIELKDNIRIINNQINIGYEKSLERGIEYSKNLNYKYIITMDADGEHNPSDIPRILEALYIGNSIVVTNRLKKNRISEYFLSSIFNYFFSISDPLSGFKGYDIEKLVKNDIKLRFIGVGSYILIKGIISNCKIKSLDIETNNRLGESRFGKGLKIELKIIYSVIQPFFLK